MRRAAHILVLLLALGAAAGPRGARAEGPSGKDIENVMYNFINDLTASFIQPAADGASVRRLLTIGQNVQSFLSDMMGGSWQDFVPESWALPSFDWSKMGEFDYGSNLGDFMEAHDLKNLTKISSLEELQTTVATIEESFCTAESFTPGEKTDASCTGPSVTIAVVPKVCVLEAATKQVVCDPAKLVLTKAPGSCVHKYKTASVWEGKSCKISGGAGFSDEVVIGGGQRIIPLTQIDFSYEV